MTNNFGKESVLFVKTKLSNDITIIEDSYFTAPYKIAKPFYNYEENVAVLMVMCASAGIMEGDCYRINMEIGKGSAISLQGQSFSKIHQMNSGYAKQENYFELGENAFFDYDPKPAIPYAKANYTSSTVCYLQKGSQYIYSEIISCGRNKSGEQFAFKQYKNCNKVYYCDELLFIDNQLLIPEIQEVNDIGFFENYTHQATLAYFCDNIDSNLVERLYCIMEQFNNIEAGISTTHKNGIMVRMLAHGSDYLESIIKSIRTEIYRCRPITAFYI
ncbi:MAG: urease accessory protein UreD [Ruminiclostridium sp.]